MKLTTERLKKLIREELAKVNEASIDREKRMKDLMGKDAFSAYQSGGDRHYKTIRDKDPETGKQFSIEVDTRQVYGRQAEQGDYSHEHTKKRIARSIAQGGKLYTLEQAIADG